MLKNTLFFKQTDFAKIAAYAHRINDEKQSKEVGYYHLVDSSFKIIDESKDFFKDKEHIKNIILIGMGGSSCGVKALKDFLKEEKKDENKKLFIIDNTSSYALNSVLNKIKLENSFFIISSKSGTTIEVISLFKLVISHFKLKNEELKKYFVFITDEKSKLDELGKDLDIKRFFIPSNVGGRFSVLSAVGIVPLSFCGYDTKALLEGAKACYEDFFTHKKDEILQKAYHYCTHKNANINILFSYANEFTTFNEWYIQLIAESLGKKRGYKRFGITPIALIGARDQHSFLQLIMDGPKDKTVTFLKVLNVKNSPTIPNLSFKGLEDCDFANNISLQKLLNTQCEATMHALIAENLSVDLIEIDELDAWHCGYLMYYYELLTSACGIMLGINTYDQPGVEVGKLMLKNLLSH
ncbi:glucose-6-phosphate isomerase [uncultured Campylobacter sp.]|uniref:glucose-6-phosphate isomerase n=1 Tax=uncultured Campylobacter sp. TaxID=218934 RepID=UPI00260C413A|nr:glucose-6-phosphate isomerase [uncultured Campylobacter sp.]